VDQVFYRKWRPRKFSEVIGQDAIVQTLRNAVNLNRIAHAYLFAGSRGSGKTSTARIMAKAINCLNPIKGEPDNECQICVDIDSAKSLDLIEIDAASNRGIDDIRSLKNNVNFKPTKGKYKIYLIDEVHMLTEAAFNALLKTLEEPPPHIVFILATTEVHKVLSTIVSRCQRFDFLSLKVADIVSRLEKLSEDEGVETDSDTLLKVAQTASGSLRDAENIFEKLILTYGVKLESKIVKNDLNTGYEAESFELLRHIVSGDTKKCLEVIHTIEIGGSNLRFIHKMLLEYIRLVLHAKTGASIRSTLSDERIETIQKVGGQYSLSRILHCFNRLLEINFSRDLMDILPFELGVVEASADITNDLHNQETNFKDSSNIQIEKNDNLEADISKIKDNVEVTKEKVPVSNNGNHSTVINNQEINKNSDSTELKLSQWNEILNFLRLRKGKRFNLSALLRVSVAQRIEKDSLIISYKHPSHKDRLDTEIDDVAIRKVIEDAFEQFLGTKYTIQLKVEESLIIEDKEKSLVDAAEELGAVIIGQVDHRSIQNDEEK
jgi:DNA polymerase-3 subunit gamma/tau